MPDNKNVNPDTENLRVSDEEIEENTASGKSREDKIKAKVNDLVINKAAQERFQEIEAEKSAVTDIYIKDKRSGGTYNAAPADIGKKKDLAKSVAEIQRMQDSIILNYKDAIGDVHYSIGSDLSDAQYNAELRNRLKSHNDAYFTSMYMSVFSPVSKEGVTIKSLFEIKGSMEALKAFNPNADMDKARLFGRLKDNIAASSKNHGVFYKAIMNPVSHYLESVSADSTSKGVATAAKNDDLDSLVMSPRMLAAMKVNFDEQYYYDTRRLSQSDKNYNEKMETYKKQYDKAIEHVVAIAQNSGYDMSAIAEEERYIVGMKMINSAGDSPYNVIYRQTASMYGVRPVDMQGNPRMSNTSLFRGDFESVDGHPYTTGGSKRGAFEVSHRLSDNDGSLSAYKDELSRNGRQLAWMINYTKSDVCNLDPTQKKAAIQRLEEIMTQRKEDATMRLKIDLGISKSEAAKIYDDNFNRGYNKGKSTDMRYAFSEVEGIFDKNHMAIDGIDLF